MARPDGRVQPGQRLDTAFSARAWNRAQDAADLVLGTRDAFGAESTKGFTLPCQQSLFRLTGFYGQAAIVKPPDGVVNTSSLLDQPTTPVTSEVTGSLSDLEKALPSRAGVDCVLTTAQSASVGLNEYPIVICSNPPNGWTWSGYAVTRIRVFSYGHRFARAPVACGLNDDRAEGCLDSCAFSDVRIIGYVRQSDGIAISSAALTFPNHQYRWALVSL